MHRYIIIWVGLIVCATAGICGCAQLQAFLAPETMTTLYAAKGRIRVDHGISYYIEHTPLSIEQATQLTTSQWRATSGKILNLGACEEPVWVRFDLRNGDERSVRWYLELKWSSLDQVDVHLQPHASAHNGGVPNNAQLLALHKDAVAHRNFIYPLSIPAKTSATVYVRLYSDTKLIVPIELWQKEPLRKDTEKQSVRLGLFLGVFAVMAFYNLFLYLPTRDQGFLYFSLFVFSLLFYTLVVTGVGMHYLWPEAYWFKHHGYGIVSALSFLTGAFFIRRYLRLEQYGGWILRINTGFILYWIAGLGLYLFYSSPSLIQFQDWISFLSTIAGMGTALYCWAKKDDSARLFSIAWIVLTVSTILLFFSILGVLWSISTALIIQMSGFAIMVVLLSFALAERINRERTAQSQAHQEALELSKKIADERADKLEARKRTLELERRTSAELEKRVQVRTSELEQTMQALESANQEMAILSETDSLTKLYNRRYFDRALVDYFEQAQRNGDCLAVALGDIDHFKVINDTHGHLIGDACLALVAKTIQEQVDFPHAMAARYGGEEFAVLMIVSDPQQAYQLAEKIRVAVEKISYSDRSATIALRISIGLAAWLPGKGESAQYMVQTADKAMYRAKKDGRNRVVLDDGNSK